MNRQDWLIKMQDMAALRGGTCLSDSYVNAKTKLLWKCSAGHEWEASPNNVTKGTWCPRCSKLKVWEKRRAEVKGKRHQRTDSELQAWLVKMQELAASKGGKCLSKLYEYADRKLSWQCAEGHTWNATPNNISNGTWCPVCARVRVNDGRRRTIEQLKAHAHKKGGQCLTDELENATSKIQWKCHKGHEWEATPQSVMGTGNWCPQCGHERNLQRLEELRPLRLAEVKRIAEERGGHCLSEEYQNSKAKLKFECANGHIWNATADGIRSGIWCPDCAARLGERICREHFEQLLGKKFPKAKPKWLISPRNTLFELDGYCEELGLAFEHHGAYHYKIVPPHSRTKHDVEKRQLHDKLKREICEEHGVHVIEIPEVPSMTTLENLKAYIVEKCIALGISIPKHNLNRSIDLKAAYAPVSTFAELKEIALRHGGRLESREFEGWDSPLLWSCANGHEWKAGPRGIYRGTWCPYCAGVDKKSVDQMKAIASERGGEFLSTNYVGAREKYLWRCKEGHQWFASPTNITSKNSWCPYCAGQKGEHLTIERMREIARSRSGECLSESYINSKTKLRWKCAKGHEWDAIPLNVANKGSWCPYCRKKINL